MKHWIQHRGRWGLHRKGLEILGSGLLALVLCFAAVPAAYGQEEQGPCVRGQGYWRTHSTYGPAPYDSTWAEIGEDTPFYTAEQSYYEVLWTPPESNVYYILAPKVIAAELNAAASSTLPTETLLQAQALLAAYTPSDPALQPAGDLLLRDQFLSVAGTLAAEMQTGGILPDCPSLDDDSDLGENGDTGNTGENGDTGSELSATLSAESEASGTFEAAVQGPVEIDTLAPPTIRAFAPTLSRGP